LLVTCASIVLEMKADKDLRVFRSKHRSAPELLTEGIWSWCRHPNYLGEVIFWWGIGLLGLGQALRGVEPMRRNGYHGAIPFYQHSAHG